MCLVFSLPYSIWDHKREHRRSLRSQEHDWRHLCSRCSGLRDKEEGESRLLAHIPLQFPQLSSEGKQWMPRQTLPDVMCSWLEFPCICPPLNYLTTSKIVSTCATVFFPLYARYGVVHFRLLRYNFQVPHYPHTSRIVFYWCTYNLGIASQKVAGSFPDEFFIDTVLPAAPWPYGRLSL